VIPEDCPPAQARKKKKRKTSKFVKLTAGMREKGINNMEWIGREEWRRKIKI